MSEREENYRIHRTESREVPPEKRQTEGRREAVFPAAQEEAEVCEVTEVHENLLKFVRISLMEPDETENLAELFKMFGDPTRLRILSALFASEVCVCDLAEALSMTQSAISHQLKLLKQAKLVRARRDGKQVFYMLADDHVRTIMAMGREHIEE